MAGSLNEGVPRLSILVGALGVFAWTVVFLGILLQAHAEIGNTNWGRFAIVFTASAAIAFMIPWALVRAVAWVVIGFRR